MRKRRRGCSDNDWDDTYKRTRFVADNPFQDFSPAVLPSMQSCNDAAQQRLSQPMLGARTIAHAHKYNCTFMHMHVHINTHAHTHTFAHTYVRTRAHTRTQSRTHIQRHRRLQRPWRSRARSRFFLTTFNIPCRCMSVPSVFCRVFDYNNVWNSCFHDR